MNHAGTFKPGDIVGPYAIERLIGVGFMGEVYRAVHRSKGETAALKCLQVRHLDNADLVERARREAAALCAIRHVNIVYVHEAGVTEGGVIWMAMELLAGRSLRQVIKAHSGGMPLPMALHYACEIADGVDAAHEHSIVHRDLKPENVHVTEKNEIRVLDLGTAKFFGQDIETTGRAQVFGTIPYMSPEHIAGERVDARTDVYALGMMLYEMIAGVHPLKPYFESMLELGRAQLFQMPRPLFEVVPSLPGYAWSIVEKAIMKDRERRFFSMSEFARAIRQVRRRYEGELRASEDAAGNAVTLPRTSSRLTPEAGVERAPSESNGGPAGGFRPIRQTVRMEPPGSERAGRISSPSWVPSPEIPFGTPPGGGPPQKLGPFGTQVIPVELRSAMGITAQPGMLPEPPGHERTSEIPPILSSTPQVMVTTRPVPSAPPVLAPKPPRVYGGAARAEVSQQASQAPVPLPGAGMKKPRRSQLAALLVSLLLMFALYVVSVGWLRSRGANSADVGGPNHPQASDTGPAPVPASLVVAGSPAASLETTRVELAPISEPVGRDVSAVSPSAEPFHEPERPRAAKAPMTSAPKASEAATSGQPQGSPPKPLKTASQASRPPPKATASAPAPAKPTPIFDF